MKQQGSLIFRNIAAGRLSFGLRRRYSTGFARTITDASSPSAPAPSTSSVLYSKINTPPLKVVKADGNYLRCEDGREIFDATAGAAVASLGHRHPSIKPIVLAQLDDVGYCYGAFFTTDAVERISSFLTESTGGKMSRVFVVSSGTEAVEASLKLARQYFVERAEPRRTRFIARKQSYHGNTLGSLATGYHRPRRSIYESILARNVSHVSPCYPYRDKTPGESDEAYAGRLADELEREFQAVGPDTVCAFIAETISGTTLGCVPAVPGYFKAIKSVCERHGALLILDEVMSGMGRSGTLHAWEQEGVVPDLQTVAKGLGAGYASIGALLIGKNVVETLTAGTGSFIHSQTYQGHPVACATAYAVQQVIQREQLLENVRVQGKYLGSLLHERLLKHKNIGDIRGRGLFWGLEFVQDKESKRPFPASEKIAAKVHQMGLEPQHGISLIPSSGTIDGIDGDIVLLSPAYNISRADVELIVERTAGVIHDVLGS